MMFINCGLIKSEESNTQSNKNKLNGENKL